MDVVPIKIHPQIPFFLPIVVDFVVFSENLHEVLRMVFADIFHTKIINSEGGAYCASFVFPKSRNNLTLVNSLSCLVVSIAVVAQ